MTAREMTAQTTVDSFGLGMFLSYYEVPYGCGGTLDLGQQLLCLSKDIQNHKRQYDVGDSWGSLRFTPMGDVVAV